MTIFVAGAAALYDLICVAAAPDVPLASAVGVLAASPGAAGHWSPGGAAATIALAMRRQGCQVALFHPLPAAGSGDVVRRGLVRAGIDVSWAPAAAAARCVIVTAADRLAWSGAPDATGLVVADGLLDGVAQVVIASRWGAWTAPLLQAAAARGIPCSLVGEPAPQAAAYDWYCVVLDAAQDAALALAATWRVVTHGAAGAMLHHAGRVLAIPAVPVDAVDTTGAGDVFGGTFLGRLIAGDDAGAAGYAAAAAAARCCAGWGAWAGLDAAVPRAAAPDQPSRVRGALMGLACGDAFGMPNSFLPTPPWLQQMQPGPPDSPYHAGYAPGRITDDTEQALALTAALEDGISPQSVAQRLNEWFVSVGGADSLAVGPSTRRAMLAFQQGADVRQIGRAGVTNGGAMRVAPIGVYAALRDLDLPGLVDVVEIACLPTHNTGPAIAGAAAIAAAVAAGVAGADWPGVMAAAQAAARQGAARGAWVYAADVAARIAQALRIAAACDGDAALLDAISDVVGAGEPTTESVPAALAIADYANGDPARAIRLAGNLRGDTDTVAAMAGAVCGAYAGIAALPADWLQLVRTTNRLDEGVWADRLYACATASARS